MEYWFRYIELSKGYLPVNATLLWAATFRKDLAIARVIPTVC
ncbi:hypothetical protein [Nostoc sp. LEGE 12450]|nr:hypothetical protein [Nostoc sp. LEGE 12450]